MKKALSLILASLLLLSAAGCGDTEGSSDTADVSSDTVTTEETVEEVAAEETEFNIYSTVPEADFGGKDFIFYIPTNPDTPVDMGLTAEEEVTGVTFDDAVFNRNQQVNEMYNVKLSSYQGGWYGSTYDDLKPNVLSGDNVYDVYFTHVYSRNIEIYQENLCTEWTNVPYISMDQPWWNEYATSNLNLANRMVYAISSINIKDVMTLLFNKELAEANGIDNLYEMVDNGTWTVDKVYELTCNLTLDLNGDGELKADDDQFGLVYGTGWQLPSLMYACDVTTISLDDEGFPTLLLGEEKMLGVFEKLYRLINSEGTHTYQANYPDVGMETGRGFLVLYNLFTISSLRDGDVDYGILPLPKYDEAQKEYMTNSWVGMMCLPITTPTENFEMIGTLMEVLSYTGYADITPLYYDNVLKSKLSRDEDSARMLDIILANTVYDLGCNFNGASHPASFMANLINSKNEGYESQLKKTEKVMTKIYTAMYEKAVENRENQGE